MDSFGVHLVTPSICVSLIQSVFSLLFHQPVSTKGDDTLALLLPVGGALCHCLENSVPYPAQVSLSGQRLLYINILSIYCFLWTVVLSVTNDLWVFFFTLIFALEVSLNVFRKSSLTIMLHSVRPRRRFRPSARCLEPRSRQLKTWSAALASLSGVSSPRTSTTPWRPSASPSRKSTSLCIAFNSSTLLT